MGMLGTIKAILFDLDETLLDRDATMLRFLRGQYARFDLEGVGEVFSQGVLSHQAGGYADKFQAYQLACEEVGFSPSVAKALYEDFILNYGDDSVMIAGVREVLEVLSGQYALGMVTNGRSRSQRGKIKGAKLESFFSVIKVSGEEDAQKPDPEIFQSCLEALDCEPQQAIFVGDHPVNDIEGPHQIGMKTVWVETARYQEAPKADVCVRHISEILSAENASILGLSGCLALSKTECSRSII